MDLINYPKIKEFAEISFFNFYFKEFPWEQCEERFAHKKSLLSKLAESLYSKNQIQEAFSIVTRHNLFDVLNIKFPKGESSHEKIEILPNKLFSDDMFAPFEVAYNKEEESNFITLKNFGIHENDIFFVSEENQIFIEAFDNLFSSKIVN